MILKADEEVRFKEAVKEALQGRGKSAEGLKLVKEFWLRLHEMMKE